MSHDEAPGTGGRFAVVNPATGEQAGEAPRCSQAQLDEAMAAAAAAWPAWSADEAGRREALRTAAKAVGSAAPALGATVTLEQGKPKGMAIGEAFAASAVLRGCADLELEPVTLRDDDRAHVELVRRPLGVAAAITPWNFPVAIAAAKIAPALRAGNTIVVKPSPHTPLSTLQLGELLAGVLPPGVCTVVAGDDALGAAIVGHATPAVVSLTGAIETGRRVAASTGAQLKRTILELGGNDAAIVLDDVDPADVAGKLFWEAFANSGQACLLIKRLYVPRARRDEIVEALVARARATRIGDGADKGVELGPVTTEAQLDRLEGLVAAAIAGGARLATGGRRLDRPGFFFPPSVLVDVDDSMAVASEEQFGPLLPVLAYDDVEDALARANDTHYGLGGSVWATDEDRAWSIATRLECGTAWVNSHSELGGDQPVAPAKCSGVGVEGGLMGLHEYTALQVRRRPGYRPTTTTGAGA